MNCVANNSRGQKLDARHWKKPEKCANWSFREGLVCTGNLGDQTLGASRWMESKRAKKRTEGKNQVIKKCEKGIRCFDAGLEGREKFQERIELRC